jgi:ribosomal protein S27AE
MQPPTWVLLPILWLGVAMVGSYVAGLRGWDKLQGFKTCLLWGPIGVVRVAFGKEPVPDIEVKCPHCGRRQVISGDLDRFECGQCWRHSDVLRPVV